MIVRAGAGMEPPPSGEHNPRAAMARRLRIFFAGLSVLALLVYVALALMRCVHPYELEWQEGGVLQEVRRVLAGQRLYEQPSFEYMAFPYTPLFVWLGALSSKLFGTGFLALRLVSILSSAACFVLVYRLGARQGGSRFAGVFAVGLFAASYRVCGAWFDVARVDSLFLALVLGALEMLELGPGLVGAALGGLLFCVAFLSKQTALVPAACVGLALLVRGRRPALVFALALGLPLVASTLYGDAHSDGWYRWYVFDLLRSHSWTGDAAYGFWLYDLPRFAPVAGLALLAWLRAPRVARSEEQRAPILPYALAGLVLGSWISRAHVGGYDNTLMPACLAAALCFGPALARALETGGLVTVGAALLALGQFWLLRYDPRAQLPSPADVAAGEALVERLRLVGGELWIPDHGYLGERVGQRALAHGMTLIDLLNSSERALAQRVADELNRALEEHRFQVIVLDQDWSDALPALAKNYIREELPYADAQTFVPVTGDERRPRYWYAWR